MLLLLLFVCIATFTAFIQENFCNFVITAYYDKTYFFDLEADTLDLGSLDHDKEKCFWNFFHILQNTPYQVQITFCNLYSES